MIRYRAVVFDYFGTLTRMLSPAAFKDGLQPLANALGVPGPDLERAMHGSFSERSSGEWGTFEETMIRLAGVLGATPTPSELDGALDARLRSQRILVDRLREDSVPTLRTLREMGLKIGLISDCTHELPLFWNELPIAPFFDALRFSVEEGTKKPDPSLYLSVASALGVSTDECLYVGDGGSNELEGARAVGMDAILFESPDPEDAVVYVRRSWQGRSIQTLSEIPALMETRKP